MRRGRRLHLQVGTFLMLRAVCVFDAVLLLVFAALLARYMQHPAGLIGGGLCCLGAGLSFGAAHWLDRLYARSS
jgi:hypothetical protein